MLAPTTVLLTVAVTTTLLAGCASPQQRARDAAIEQVRASARGLGDRLGAAAAVASPSDLPEDVRTLTSGVGLTVRSLPDGSVTATGGLVSSAEDGGGLSYAKVLARVCVEYSARAGRAEVPVRDVPCPADAPPADETVLLRG